MLKIKFQKFLSFLFVFKKLGNIRAALFFSKYHKNYSFSSGDKFYWKKNKLVLPSYNISFTKSEISLFHRNLKNILDTARKYKIEKTQDGKLLLCVMKNALELKIKVGSFDSINALNEIFIEGLYHFNSKKDFVVVDIGMNVGIASLYFATDCKVKKIYGYEPFEKTFRMALDNFEMNPELAEKITPRNYGLSNVNKDLDVPFSTPGFMGASTTSFFIAEQEKMLTLGNQTARVRLRSVSDELQEVMIENKDLPIFMKIDCEGAEFEIIENLKSTGLLKFISLAIIEWHFKDKFIIVQALEGCGFLVFSQDRDAGSPMGMIYAINRNNIL